MLPQVGFQNFFCFQRLFQHHINYYLLSLISWKNLFFILKCLILEWINFASFMYGWNPAVINVCYWADGGCPLNRALGFWCYPSCQHRTSSSPWASWWRSGYSTCRPWASASLSLTALQTSCTECEYLYRVWVRVPQPYGMHSQWYNTTYLRWVY